MKRASTSLVTLLFTESIILAYLIVIVLEASRSPVYSRAQNFDIASEGDAKTATEKTRSVSDDRDSFGLSPALFTPSTPNLCAYAEYKGRPIPCGYWIYGQTCTCGRNLGNSTGGVDCKFRLDAILIARVDWPYIPPGIPLTKPMRVFFDNEFSLCRNQNNEPACARGIPATSSFDPEEWIPVSGCNGVPIATPTPGGIPGGTPTPTPTPTPPPPPPPPSSLPCVGNTGSYCFGMPVEGYCPLGTVKLFNCCCYWSPLIIDLDGNGFQFTNVGNGVLFDAAGNGVLSRTPWTVASSADGWLALDRNSNGTIDDGKELFGNFTQQNGDPMNRPNNGFNALRYFDESLNGGNEDGKIDWEDNVYNALRIWVDTNHNGISEPNELRTMQAAGVDSVDLDYYESQLTDAFGNRFKYKSQAFAYGWKTICDVYPNAESPSGPLFSQYEPIKVCDGSGLGTTMLGWNAPGIASTQVRIGSATGTLFAQGGSSGRVQTGKWVTNGMVFYLIDSSNGATIGTYTANVSTTSGCP